VCLYVYVCCVMGGAAIHRRSAFCIGSGLPGFEAWLKLGSERLRKAFAPFGAREIRAGISSEPGISASVGVLGAPLAV
jgi:hypothetical protein